MSRTPSFALVTPLVALLLAAGCTSAPPGTPVPSVDPPTTSATPAAAATTAAAEAPPTAVPTATEAASDATGFGLLTAVRVAGRGTTDRIVFEFAEAVPGYRISYVDLPVYSDPAGEEVPLAGTAALQVSLIGSSAYREVGDPEPAFDVPRRLSGDTARVTELVNLGDFERVLVWAAGVRGRTGFAVSTLEAPPRLVIDVAR